MTQRRLRQGDVAALDAATSKLLDGLDKLRQAMTEFIDSEESFDDSSPVVPLLDAVSQVLHAWDESNAAGMGLPVALWRAWREAR